VMAMLQPLAQEKQQSLNTIIPHGTQPAVVLADKMALKRVMTNLIGNAIRYTQPEGRIDIDLLAHNHTWRWAVVDNGRGIPEADLKLLFQRFVQGTQKHRNTGSGLGLYLSKKIIEAHNGHIWAESSEGHGSQFYVQLPAHEAPST
jgi:two-component system, sensor histidine kinase and response regulator